MSLAETPLARVVEQRPASWTVLPAWALLRPTKRLDFPELPILSLYRDHGVVPKDSRDDNHNKDARSASVYQLVEPGDVVINKMKAWQGSVAVSELRGVVSPDYDVLRPEGYDGLTAFLHHLLRSAPYISEYARRAYGIRPAQWRLMFENFRTIPILVPPVQVQAAIADFLDRKTAAIDGLIAKKERLIELLEEKRQALITQAVTKGLDPNVPMKDSGIDWLGPIPAHWRLSTLGREGCFMPGTGFPHEYQGLVGEELPFFKVGDMAVAENSIELKVAAHSISRETARVLKARICPAGSIAFAKVGAALLLNRRRLTVDDCIFDNNMMAYRPYDQEPRFAWLWMQLIDLSKIAQPGPVPSITATAVGQMPYALPPRAEQEVIAAFARSVQERHANVKRALQESIERLREYRQALITAAVTGKIDVTREEAAEIPDSDG